MENLPHYSTECATKNESNFQFSMDYDSGYMSHNPESNLDSSSETYENLVGASEKPIYLSEDALLEKPLVTKFTNTVEEAERQNYEIRDSLNMSDNETVLSSSVISQESNYCDLDKDESESNLSIEIPRAKKIVFELKNNFAGKLDENNRQSNAPLINITNTLATNDPKKKLTLIFSKDGKENIYSVKRKFKSLTPNKSVENISNNSSFEEVPDSFDENVPSNGNEKLEESLSSLNVVNSIHNMTINNCVINTLPTVEAEQLEEQDSSGKHILITESVAFNGTTESDDPLPSFVHNSNNKLISKQPDTVTVMSESLQIVESTKKQCDSELMGTNVDCLSHCNLTPQKKYCNPINSNISPDLFAEDPLEPAAIKESYHTLDYIAEEQFVVKQDQRLLRRVQNSLKGVLPPHSITVVQMSVNEILNRLESNRDYFWNNEKTVEDNSTMNSSTESSTAGEYKSLLINACMEECKKDKWPGNLRERNLGLHHNRSKLSEQFEDLCAKYAKRYVGAETQSSCTVFEVNCSSPKKRIGNASKSRWTAKSPGRRLSHLARRRITFSSANLQAGGSSAIAGNRARQILVDAKKLDLLNRRRSPRKTPRKTPNKSPSKKSRTPSSSAKKKLAMRFRKLTGEIESTNGPPVSSANKTLYSKRALFQSPEKNKESTLFVPSTFGVSTFENDCKKPTKRALFMSPSKSSPLKNKSITKSPFKRLDLGQEKKRKRDGIEDTDPPSKFARSTSLILKNLDNTNSSSLIRTKSDSVVTVTRPAQPAEMSAANKKKLQWAVYEALRSQNVTPTHAQFKVFASILARVVRRLFYQLTAATASISSTSGSGTTERMLRLARRHASSVVNGRTVDEVLGEYAKMRSKQQKPQGYVGIEEFKASKDQRSILADRTRTMNNLENRKVEEPSKPKIGGDNRIDRIRKVINFGDDYSR